MNGELWSVPFQRSTAVLYWNKKAFAESGLNPEKYPTTWDEMVAYGKAVTRKDASGKVTRWGVGIPGNVGSAQWLFGALVAQNGGKLFNENGTETYLTDPKVVQALAVLGGSQQGERRAPARHPGMGHDTGRFP